jgi:hypothetical protein
VSPGPANNNKIIIVLGIARTAKIIVLQIYLFNMT